ncbi:hypothetical protein EDC52_102585 [Biostraticola tofi]|uniref:Uncharacterized protein n=1 Tax=Biostraticola tofi TaxID=466109 RepID=A0A4R3Z4I5_9GAMM|nr:hypothetical protein EDC52_102585 [Biostraticola tofi]
MTGFDPLYHATVLVWLTPFKDLISSHIMTTSDKRNGASWLEGFMNDGDLLLRGATTAASLWLSKNSSHDFALTSLEQSSKPTSYFRRVKVYGSSGGYYKNNSHSLCQLKR